jgi:SAM-dependent methyltransferase
VFATDLYWDPGAEWESQAPRGMLSTPGDYAPCPWNPRRLVVQHMNALELQYESEVFDAVFSSSSIEHFGGLSEVRRSLGEIHRVLKPGGVVALSTELRLSGRGDGLEGTLLFPPDLLLRLFGELAWSPTAPPVLDPSAATLRTIVPFKEAVADIQAKRGWSTYPHIVLSHDGYTWTSVHLAYRKDGP